MISFEHPVALVGLVPLAFALWWLFRLREPALRFPIPWGVTLSALPKRNRRRDTAFALGCVAIVMAVVNPRIPDERTRVTTLSARWMLVLDDSPSMEIANYRWLTDAAPISRREAARRVLRLFIDGGEAPDGTTFRGRVNLNRKDAIGLIYFAIWPELASPPTLSHRVILDMLGRDRPRTILDAGTNVGDALMLAVASLEGTADESRAILLVSDGEHNFTLDDPERKPILPRQAAQIAGERGIAIHALDVGEDPEMIGDAETRAQREQGRQVLRDLAARTGGVFATASDGTELVAAARKLDGLTATRREAGEYRRYFDSATPWLAVAFGCFVVWGVISPPSRSRRPNPSEPARGRSSVR